MEQSLHGTSLEPAEEAIEEGNIKLQEALTDKKNAVEKKFRRQKPWYKWEQSERMLD